MCVCFLQSQFANVNCPWSYRFTLVLMDSACLLLCLLPFVAWSVSAKGGADTSDVLSHSSQMIVVTTSNWNAVEGRLQRYERSGTQETWHPVGELISIVVVRNGMAWGIELMAVDAPTVRIASDRSER